MTRGESAEVSDEKNNQVVELTEISESNGNGCTIHENGNGSHQTTNSRPARPSEPAPLPPEVTLTPIIHRPTDVVVNHSRFRFPVSPSSSTGHCGRLRSRWIVGTSAILLSLLTVGVFLGIMLHFTVQDHRERHAPPATPTTPRVPRAETALGDAVPAFLCSVTLSHQYWEPELADVRSERYKQLAIDTEQELDRIFLVSPLREIYNFSVVRTFRRGSIVVVFETVLTRPSHLSTDQLKRAFLDGLEYRERMLLSEAQDTGRENSEQKSFLQLNKENIVLVVPSTTTLHPTSLKTDFHPWQISTEYDQTWTTGRQERWNEDIKLPSTTRPQLPRTVHTHPESSTIQHIPNIIDPYGAASINATDEHSWTTLMDDKFTRKSNATTPTFNKSDARGIIFTTESLLHHHHDHHGHHEESEDILHVLSSSSSFVPHTSSVIPHQSLDNVHTETQSKRESASSLYSTIVTTTTYPDLAMSSSLQSDIMTTEIYLKQTTTKLRQILDATPFKTHPDLTPTNSLKSEFVTSETSETSSKSSTTTSLKSENITSQTPTKTSTTLLPNNTTEPYTTLAATTQLYNEDVTNKTSVNNNTSENKEMDDSFKVNTENKSIIYEHTNGLESFSSQAPTSIASETQNNVERKQPTFSNSSNQSSEAEESHDKWRTKSNETNPRNLTEKYRNTNKILRKNRPDVSSLNDDNMIPTDKPRYLDKIKSRKDSPDVGKHRLKHIHTLEPSPPKMLNSQRLGHGLKQNNHSFVKADDSSNFRIIPSEVSRISNTLDSTESFTLEPSAPVTVRTASPTTTTMTPALLNEDTETLIITRPSLFPNDFLTSSSTILVMTSLQVSSTKEYTSSIKGLPYLESYTSYSISNSVGQSEYQWHINSSSVVPTDRSFSMNVTKSNIGSYSSIPEESGDTTIMLTKSSILTKDVSNYLHKLDTFASPSKTYQHSTESFTRSSPSVLSSVISHQLVTSSRQSQTNKEEMSTNSAVVFNSNPIKTHKSESKLEASVFPTSVVQDIGNSKNVKSGSYLDTSVFSTSVVQKSETDDSGFYSSLPISSASVENLGGISNVQEKESVIDESVSSASVEQHGEIPKVQKKHSIIYESVSPTSIIRHGGISKVEEKGLFIDDSVSPASIVRDTKASKVNDKGSSIDDSFTPSSTVRVGRISDIEYSEDILHRRSSLLIQPTTTLEMTATSRHPPSNSRSTHEPVSKIPDIWSSTTAANEIYNPCLDINIMTEFIPQCLDYFSQIQDTTDTVEKCQHFLAGVICVTDYYFNYSGQQCSESEIRAFIRQHATLFGNALPGFNPLKCIV